MRLRNRSKSRRGAAMVETAVVLSLFVVPLALGTLDTARVCMVSQLFTNAAREGCRVAVSQNKTSSDVTTRVSATLSASGITTTVTPVITIVVAPGNSPATTIDQTHLGDSITVSLAIPYSSVRWLQTPFIGSSYQITAKATMSSERPPG